MGPSWLTDLESGHEGCADSNDNGKPIIMRLPGWDSIEFTMRAHNFFELWGIVLFLVVVGFEFLAYFYGHRRDKLVDQATNQTVVERRQAEEATEARHARELDNLKDQLSEADKKLGQVQKQQSDRRLSDDQKQAILAAISPYPGQKVDIVAVANVGDALAYAEDFRSLFEVAKWDYGSGVSQDVYTGDVVGLSVLISDANGKAHRAPIGAAKLMLVLIQLGLIKEGFSDPNIEGDVIQIRIGRKPTPP
jgi:hypothetical protein